jgi:hypothetical protein
MTPRGLRLVTGNAAGRLQLGSRPWTRATAAGAALVAVAATVLVPAVPAAAATGEVVIAVSTGSAIQLAKKPDDSSTWTVQKVASGLYGQPSVALESNGITVVAAIFETGTDRGTLYYFWQAAGGTVWHRQQVSAIAAAAPLVPPSIAGQKVIAGQSADTIIVAQNAAGTGSTYYWQAIGTTPWRAEAIPTVNGTASAPYVTVDSDNTSVVSFATPRGFGFDRQAYGASSWETVQEVYPGFPEQGVEAADENDGRIVVSATETGDSALDFFYNGTGSVHDWFHQYLSSDADDQSSMAVNSAEHSVTMAAYDPSWSSGECVSTYTQTDGSSAWHKQAYVACPGIGGNADVAIAAQSNGGLVMAAIDSSLQVEFAAEAAGGTKWTTTLIPSISFAFNTPAIAAN